MNVALDSHPRLARGVRLRHDEALAIMYRGYDKMGNVTLRDDTKRVFEKNFPQSKMLADDGQKKTAWYHFW